MMVTLTHHHDRDGHLSDQLALQAVAIARMQRTGNFRKLCAHHGLIGTIRSLEVTHSRRAGWHVHLHLILLLLLAGSEAQAERHAVLMRRSDAGAPNRRKGRTVPDRPAVRVAQVRQLPAFGREYIAAWCKAAAVEGLHAKRSDQRAAVASCDLASLERLADYLTKAGRSPGAPRTDDLAAFSDRAEDHAAAVRAVEGAGQKSSTDIARKVASGPLRHRHGRGKTPLEYLRAYTFADDVYAGALYAEYTAAIAGRAAIIWTRGLKALYRIRERTAAEDQRDVARAMPAETLLVTITPTEWRAVLRGPPLTRGHLLELARTQDLQGLRRRLDELLALPGPPTPDSQGRLPDPKYEYERRPAVPKTPWAPRGLGHRTGRRAA